MQIRACRSLSNRSIRGLPPCVWLTNQTDQNPTEKHAGVFLLPVPPTLVVGHDHPGCPMPHLLCDEQRVFPLPGLATSWLKPGPPASLTFKTDSQGCDHVAVAGWQGSQCGRCCARVAAPSPGAQPSLPHRRRILPRVRGLSGDTGHGITRVCPAGIRRLPLKLSMPEGWQGQSLSGEPIPTIDERPVCAKEFNDPVYW